jgi:hypothetical protein
MIYEHTDILYCRSLYSWDLGSSNQDISIGILKRDRIPIRLRKGIRYTYPVGLDRRKRRGAVFFWGAGAQLHGRLLVLDSWPLLGLGRPLVGGFLILFLAFVGGATYRGRLHTCCRSWIQLVNQLFQWPFFSLKSNIFTVAESVSSLQCSVILVLLHAEKFRECSLSIFLHAGDNWGVASISFEQPEPDYCHFRFNIYSYNFLKKTFTVVPLLLQ